MADKKLYRYPYTMLSRQTDYLQIDIVGYTPIRDTVRDTSGPGGYRISDDARPSFDSLTRGFDGKGQDLRPATTSSLAGRAGNRKNSNKESKGTILLPIPSNISDTNAVDYESSSLNSIAGAAVGGVMDAMGTGGDYINEDGKVQFVKGLTSTFNTLQSTASSVNQAVGGGEQVKGFITRFLASKAVGLANVNITPSQILARSTGEIMNPNMELLFNGPRLRSFRFQFKLTPRGKKEAAEVLSIIRTFKEHMAPKVSNAGTFLKTPDVFELRYRKGTAAHPFLHKFKQCFLKEVNVNYTGEGTYTTYNDGTPVSMIMDLSFQEIEPIYDIDYDGGFTGPLADPKQAFKSSGVGY